MAAAGRADVQEWLASTPLVAMTGNLLDWVGAGRGLEEGDLLTEDDDTALQGMLGVDAEARRSSHGPAAWRSRLLLQACLHLSLLDIRDGRLHLGGFAEMWRSSDAPARGLARVLLAVTFGELAVRLERPPESWVSATARRVLAEALGAAVTDRPWDADAVSAACEARDRFGVLIAADVDQHVAELAALGLLDHGPVIITPPGGAPVLGTVAAALARHPLPPAVRPDSVVRGPTYEIDVDVEGCSSRRWRRLRIGGASRAWLLTSLIACSFGLELVDRDTGYDAGHLMGAGDDPADPWALRVGWAEDVEQVPVVDSGVSVTSVLQHLGEELVMTITPRREGRYDGDVRLRLHVVRAVPERESAGLVFPACVAGGGPGLDVAVRAEEAADQPSFDLVAVESAVARVFR